MTHAEARATMQLSSEGAVGVPLKFVLVRGRRVVEQRRTRLLCPSLEDVKGCVRQWACGAFTLRYVDDEGDLVTVDLDEEWAECVALWREARGTDDADADVDVDVDVCAQQQRALRLVVALGAQDGSAVCLGQQRHPRQAFWDRVRQHRDAQRDGHMHMHGHGHRHQHHQHVHGRHGAMLPGIRQLLAEWHAHARTQGQEQKQQEVESGSGSESVTDVTPCCRRSVKHAGEHGPRCRVHGRKNADATDVPQAAVAEVCCAGEGCCYAVTRRHGTHCCHMCARGGGQHGPRCEQRHMETSDVEAAAPAVVGEDDVPQSVQEGTPCCRRSVKHAGKHGPRCRVHGRKNADATDVLVEQTEEGTPAEAVSEEVKPCCRRSVKHAGKHGPHCRVHGKKSGDDATDKAAQTGATAQTPEEVEALQSVQEGTPCCRRSVKHAGKHGPHCRVHGKKSADATEAVEVPSQEEEEEEDVTAGVSDAALLVCAGCSFEVTGVHATHCCVRCAKHAGQHGPRCEQKMSMAAEEDVQVEDNEDEDEDVVAVPAQTEETEAEREEEQAATVVCEEDSAGVTALRNMGFDITADVRAVLERHNGDVAAVLEEMM